MSDDGPFGDGDGSYESDKESITSSLSKDLSEQYPSEDEEEVAPKDSTPTKKKVKKDKKNGAKRTIKKCSLLEDHLSLTQLHRLFEKHFVQDVSRDSLSTFREFLDSKKY